MIKRDKLKLTRFLIILIVGILILPLVIAEEEAELIKEELITVEGDMQELIKAGFSIVLYNDTLITANQLYEAQNALDRIGKKADYSQIQEKILQLKELKRKSFIAFDELNALNKAIGQVEGIDDKTPVLELYNQAEEAFYAERYDEAEKLIDQTYEKVSELEALQTKVKAFYDATTRGLVSFLKERWIAILVLLAIITTTYFLTHNKIAIAIIKRKITNLELRKKSIHRLIAETQQKYFEKGTMDESTYRIRTKKAAELIRDINRQIPTLKEEMELRKRKIKEEVKKKP